MPDSKRHITKVAGLIVLILFISVSLNAQTIGLYGSGFVSNYYYQEGNTMHDGFGVGSFIVLPVKKTMDLGAEVHYFGRSRKVKDSRVTYCHSCSPAFPNPGAPHFTAVSDITDINDVVAINGVFDFPLVKGDTFNVKMGPRVGINYMREGTFYSYVDIDDHSWGLLYPSVGIEATAYRNNTFSTKGLSSFVKLGFFAYKTGAGHADAVPPFSDREVTLAAHMKIGFAFGNPIVN